MTKKRTAVYEPMPTKGYELCHPVADADFETIITQVNGVPGKSSWRPIAVEIIGEEQGLKLLQSDSPWLGPHALVFRMAAVERLGQLLEEYGELLPLQCDGEDLSIFNPTRILDALDEASSAIAHFSTGRIMTIERYGFRPDVIQGVHVFKIPNLRASPTFVSDHFVQLWMSAGFKGLGFTQVGSV